MSLTHVSSPSAKVPLIFLFRRDSKGLLFSGAAPCQGPCLASWQRTMAVASRPTNTITRNITPVSFPVSSSLPTPRPSLIQCPLSGAAQRGAGQGAPRSNPRSNSPPAPPPPPSLQVEPPVPAHPPTATTTITTTTRQGSNHIGPRP